MTVEKETTILFIVGSVIGVVGFLVLVYICWLIIPSDIPDWVYWGGAVFLLTAFEIVRTYRYIRKKQTKPKPIPQESIRT